MTKRFLPLLPLLLLAGNSPGQTSDTLTQQERNFAMSHLNATRKKFQDSLAGLSEAQWKFKPGPDRWSIAECAEHIARSEDFLFERVTGKLMKSPPEPEKKAELKGNDEQVLKFITDRTQKAQAPEPVRPTGRWASADDVIQAFNQSRDRTVAYVEKSQEDLRGHVMPFGPALKLIDAYQMILFISGHSARHTAQIQEVKADPNFPKN